MTEIDTSAINDRSLRVFAAAVEAGSFTAAARQLGIGQPAVSHAVARLEQSLGVRLFDRHRGGIAPTDAGRLLHSRLSPALAEIDDAVAEVMAGGQSGLVTMSVSTSLATYWLTPRVPDFRAEHPEIELRIITTDVDRNVGRDDADLWIPLGAIDDPSLQTTRFCAETLVPVAAPSVAARFRDAAPADLQMAPLLHLEERYVPRFDWSRWFAHHGVTVPDELPGDRSNDYSLILHSALAGNGIALGWLHIVGRLLRSGELVAVGPTVRTGNDFPILTRQGRSSPATDAVRDWLIAHAPIEAGTAVDSA